MEEKVWKNKVDGREYHRKYRQNHKKERNEYLRKWRLKNSDKIKAYRQKGREKAKIRNQEWRRKNREKCLAISRRYYARHPEKAKQVWRNLKIEVLRKYGNGLLECACCREKNVEFLSIDHISGGGHKHRAERIKNKKYTNLYLWLKRNNYPKGFRVLCLNCNHSYGQYGYCPHQRSKDNGKVLRDSGETISVSHDNSPSYSESTFS